MKIPNRSGHGFIALTAGMAALITGLVDGSLPWLAASAVLLATWGVFFIFAVSPSVYARFIEWLETAYEQTSPRHRIRQAIPVEPQAEERAFGDPMSQSQVLDSPMHEAARVDPSNLLKAAACTDNPETTALKEEVRKQVVAIECG